MILKNIKYGQPCILIHGWFKVLRTQVISQPFWIETDPFYGRGWFVMVAYREHPVKIWKLLNAERWYL